MARGSLTTLRLDGRSLELRAPPWLGSAAAPPDSTSPLLDLAEPGATHGSDDEVWMVSYMDIMTLLLTLLVLLFVYTRAVSPEAVAAPVAALHPQPAVVQREPPPPSSTPVAALPETAHFAAVAPPPGAEPTVEFVRVAEGPSVTNPTVPTTAELEAPVQTSAMPSAGGEVGAVETAAAVPHQDRGVVPRGEAATDWDASAQVPVAMVELPSRTPAQPSHQAAADLEQSLLAAIQASELGRRVEVTRRPDAVNLEISDEILFDRGSAALKPAGEALLAHLAKLLVQQAVAVSVEGHTDDAPIRNVRFASNWELSAARATNVTRSLVAQKLDRARVRAVGYADTRPRADNASEHGRARNRRVALILHVPSDREVSW